jgi:hypothetical protein
MVALMLALLVLPRSDAFSLDMLTIGALNGGIGLQRLTRGRLGASNSFFRVPMFPSVIHSPQVMDPADVVEPPRNSIFMERLVGSKRK